MSYRHLTVDDRVGIATLLEEHRNQSYIARKIGVHRSSVSRELARNKARDKPVQTPLPERPAILDTDCRHARGKGLAQDKYEAYGNYRHAVREVQLANRFYEPRSAQHTTAARRVAANQSRIRLVYRSGDWLERYVRRRLLRNEWSPEQIAGDLKRNYGTTLHWQTIYDYIDLCPDKTDKKRLQKQLRRGGRPYCHHGTNERIKARQKALPPIQSRDAVIEQRTRLGDFEGDTIVGLDTKDRIATHVDRTSGECLLGLVLGYDAMKITDDTIRRLKKRQRAGLCVRTITYDRGTEFAEYERLQNKAAINVYFADAYTPSQRGSNENLNSLVRQYYPKRSDFKTITPRRLKTIETKLNNRPRKRYNYRTPIQQRHYVRARQLVGFVAVRDRM